MICLVPFTIVGHSSALRFCNTWSETPYPIWLRLSTPNVRRSEPLLRKVYLEKQRTERPARGNLSGTGTGHPHTTVRSRCRHFFSLAISSSRFINSTFFRELASRNTAHSPRTWRY